MCVEEAAAINIQQVQRMSGLAVLQPLTSGYSYTLRVMHWIVAVLVFAQLLLAGLNALLYEPRPILAEALLQAHISSGSLVFCCMMFRIAVRIRSPSPPRPEAAWIRYAATSVHMGFYGLLLILPISGYLKLAALGFPVTLFGAIALPVMPLNVPLAQAAASVHSIAAFMLVIAITFHVSAAIFHTRLDGKAVIGRMSLIS